jgi:outer membrane protein assembly factor BamD (BamD/ComL family)
MLPLFKQTRASSLLLCGLMAFLGILSAVDLAHGQANKKMSAASAQNSTSAYPEHPLTQKAKDAYNGGKYAQAAQHFRALSKRFPENAILYRDMARAYSWASEPTKAIVAYWHYLSLAPGAEDRSKVDAELDLLTRRVKKMPPKTASKKVMSAFALIEKRAPSGQFTGDSGAIGILKKIVEGDYIGPRIGLARKTIRTQLEIHSKRAIDRWWKVAEQSDSNMLAELTSGWELMKENGLKDSELGLLAALDGLTHLVLNEPAKAAELLAPVAPGQPRLRYAQALALMQAKDYRSAKQVLETMARGATDSRVYILLGFARRMTKDESSNDAFLNALNNEDAL